MKGKIQKLANGRPDLFENVGDETNERLDHLLNLVQNQADQITQLQRSTEVQKQPGDWESGWGDEKLETPLQSSAEENRVSDEEYRQQITQLQQKLSQKEDERALLRQRLDEVEVEFRRLLEYQTGAQNNLDEQLQSLIEERNRLLEKQQQLVDRSELSEATAEIRSLKEVIDQQTRTVEEYQQQVSDLSHERDTLLDDLKSKASSDNQAPDSDTLKKTANNLKKVIKKMKEKIQKLANDRPDLFENVGDETNERLDHLLNLVQNQANQINRLQEQYSESEQRFQDEIGELQRAFNTYKQQIGEEQVSSLSEKMAKIAIDTTEQVKVIHPVQSEHPNLRRPDDDLANDSADMRGVKMALLQDMGVQCDLLTNDDRLESKSPSRIDEQGPSVANRFFGILKNVVSPWSEQESSTNDWSDETSPLQLPADEPMLEQGSSPSPSVENMVQAIQKKVQQLVSQYPNVFLTSTNNTVDNLDRILSMLDNHLNQLRQLNSSSIYEALEKSKMQFREESIEKETIHRSVVERLIEERDQAHKQISELREELKGKDIHQSSQVELSPNSTEERSPTGEQRISRRVFEQEILAWSKESEHLKQFVKQIQIENKKLKDIILKFERIIQEYMHENERLKQENQHLSFISYSSMSTMDQAEALTSSDTDICYLTLKCLTYEVAQRISSDSGASVLTIDENDPYVRQRLMDAEQQLKIVRIQNQRLKKQLDIYTVKLKHLQIELNGKNQELSAVKIDLDKLRNSESQYRAEVDRLKADVRCDAVKFQQLERELEDLKNERNSIDSGSTNNLRELLELKERELKALKEKLDYTTQAHQFELQEAIKTNQFSLDNVERFEQLDQRHQEKQKKLETRLGKICKLVKPLFDEPQFWSEESIIDLHELKELVTDTEAEERVTTSLGSIRNCLGLLENQMKELHQNLMENHTRRSKRWKYKVGFECLSNEDQWENKSSAEDIREACQNPTMFLESSNVESTSGCACPIMIDFIESDVLLCLDDILDEVVVRTTVK